MLSTYSAVNCSENQAAAGAVQHKEVLSVLAPGRARARARPHCLIGFPSPTVSSREFQTPATYPWKTFPPFPNNQSTNYFNPCPLSLLHSRGIGSPLSRLSYFKHNYISTSPVFWNIRSWYIQSSYQFYRPVNIPFLPSNHSVTTLRAVLELWVTKNIKQEPLCPSSLFHYSVSSQWCVLIL